MWQGVSGWYELSEVFLVTIDGARVSALLLHESLWLYELRVSCLSPAEGCRRFVEVLTWSQHERRSVPRDRPTVGAARLCGWLNMGTIR